MRISDWSSDVCSSDLRVRIAVQVGVTGKGTGAIGVAGNTRAREATRLDVGFTETDFDFRTETAEVITDGSFDIIASAMIERSGIVERANIEVQALERKSVAAGKRVSVRVELGGLRFIKKKNNKHIT